MVAFGFSRRTYRCAAVGVASALLFAVSACGDDDDDDDKSSNSTQSTPSATNGSSDTNNSGATAEANDRNLDVAKTTFKVTPEQAMQISEKATGKGTIYSIELDFSERHNAWAWEVQTQVGKTDVDVDIDATSGKVLKKESENDDDDREKAISLTSGFSPADAIKKAQSAQSGRVAGWALSHDDGRATYQIDIVAQGSNESEEILVDASSGKVTRDD